ncbi:hypothetical protein IJ531_02570, partial [bacterium]|nr:hypothetical protein [bacterium]
MIVNNVSLVNYSPNKINSQKNKNISFNGHIGDIFQRQISKSAPPSSEKLTAVTNSLTLFLKKGIACVTDLSAQSQKDEPLLNELIEKVVTAGNKAISCMDEGCPQGKLEEVIS